MKDEENEKTKTWRRLKEKIHLQFSGDVNVCRNYAILFGWHSAYALRVKEIEKKSTHS